MPDLNTSFCISACSTTCGRVHWVGISITLVTYRCLMSSTYRAELAPKFTGGGSHLGLEFGHTAWTRLSRQYHSGLSLPTSSRITPEKGNGTAPCISIVVAAREQYKEALKSPA